MVFVPRNNVSKPAIVVELKWNKSVSAAIEQIKEKQYVQSLKGYSGEVVLVGINYAVGKEDNGGFKKAGGIASSFYYLSPNAISSI